MNILRNIRFSRIAKSHRPIIVGPWRSEVGFESLYWLPWLAAWRDRWKVPKDRLVVLSRGGAGAWYDAGRSAELFDYALAVDVRKSMLADSRLTGSIKQHHLTEWERLVLPVVAHNLGITKWHLLHPSEMYRQLAPWWEGSMGLSQLLGLVKFVELPVPPATPLTLQLPERYVAVRFYHRHTWPMNEELTQWVAGLVDGIAKRVPVVVLNTNLHMDDHVDFPTKGDNIISIADHVTIQNNLAVQSAVIAKAQAFVGTYGGTMQLAVRLKKPAAGFFAEFSGTAYAHKALTEWLACQQKVPCFIGRPDDARMVREVMGAIT